MPTRNCLLPRMIRIPCQLTSLCGAGYTYVLPSFFTPLFKCPRPQVGAAQRLRTRCLLLVIGVLVNIKGLAAGYLFELTADSL